MVAYHHSAKLPCTYPGGISRKTRHLPIILPIDIYKSIKERSSRGLQEYMWIRRDQVYNYTARSPRRHSSWVVSSRKSLFNIPSELISQGYEKILVPGVLLMLGSAYTDHAFRSLDSSDFRPLCPGLRERRQASEVVPSCR